MPIVHGCHRREDGDDGEAEEARSAFAHAAPTGSQVVVSSNPFCYGDASCSIQGEQKEATREHPSPATNPRSYNEIP